MHPSTLTHSRQELARNGREIYGSVKQSRLDIGLGERLLETLADGYLWLSKTRTSCSNLYLVSLPCNLMFADIESHRPLAEAVLKFHSSVSTLIILVTMLSFFSPSLQSFALFFKQSNPLLAPSPA